MMFFSYSLMPMKSDSSVCAQRGSVLAQSQESREAHQRELSTPTTAFCMGVPFKSIERVGADGKAVIQIKNGWHPQLPILFQYQEVTT